MDDHWNVPACHFDPSGQYRQRSRQTVDFRRQRVVEKVCDHIHAGRHSSEVFSDAAIDYLRAYCSEDPFFMYVSFMAPHDPRTMPQRYLDMYSPDALPLPESFAPVHPFDNGELKIRDELLAEFPRTPSEVRRHIAEYYAMITHLDAQIGRILDVIDATGRAADTLVVFSGDNGLAVGRHGLMGKQSVYDHSVHVPLVMRGPGVPAGEQSDAMCYLFDVFPTLCDLTGIRPPPSVLGRSFADAVRAPSRPGRETLYFAYRHLHRGILDGRHKLIEYAVDGQTRTQLFDLEADPHETHDLSADASLRGVRERLGRELRRLAAEAGDDGDDGKSFWRVADAASA
jgi:arylsulfatase A-like enzyme